MYVHTMWFVEDYTPNYPFPIINNECGHTVCFSMYTCVAGVTIHVYQ